MKPIMNRDEVVFDDVEENGVHTSSRGQISDRIAEGCRPEPERRLES